MSLLRLEAILHGVAMGRRKADKANVGEVDAWS